MNAKYPHDLGDEDEHDSLDLSAVRFSRTPLGRVVFHLECLCNHPAAARFHFNGLKRNVREFVESMKGSAFKSMKKLRPSKV
jgi:hypothetical protein